MKAAIINPMNIQTALNLKWYQSRVLWSFIFGFIVGGIVVGASDYSVLPKDKVAAAKQINNLQQSVTELMQHAEELANKADDQKIKNVELQNELDGQEHRTTKGIGHRPKRSRRSKIRQAGPIQNC